MKAFFEGYFSELSLVCGDFLKLFRSFGAWVFVRIKLSMLYVVPAIFAIAIPFGLVLWQINLKKDIAQIVDFFLTHPALSIAVIALSVVLCVIAALMYIVSSYHLLRGITQIQSDHAVAIRYADIFEKKSRYKHLFFPIKIACISLGTALLYVTLLIFLSLSINTTAMIVRDFSLVGALMIIGVLAISLILGMSVWKLLIGSVSSLFWYLWGVFGLLILVAISMPSLTPWITVIAVVAAIGSIITTIMIYAPIFYILGKHDHHYDVKAVFQKTREYGKKHFWKTLRITLPFWIALVAFMEILGVVHTYLQYTHSYDTLTSELSKRNEIATKTHSSPITDQMLLLEHLSPELFEKNDDGKIVGINPTIRTTMTDYTPSKDSINKDLYKRLAPFMDHDSIESRRVNEEGKVSQSFPIFYWSTEILKGVLQWALFSGIFLFLFCSVKYTIDRKHTSFFQH